MKDDETERGKSHGGAAAEEIERIGLKRGKNAH